MLFGVQVCYVSSCLYPLCFYPHVPTTFTGFLMPSCNVSGQWRLWNIHLAALRVVTQLLRYTFFRMVEVEVSGVSVPDLRLFMGSVLSSSQPKDQQFTFRASFYTAKVSDKPDHTTLFCSVVDQLPAVTVQYWWYSVGVSQY